MASKKELIQAQSYSRRRLLTVFTSGIPGGKELEPAKPLRAVVAGTALAVLLIVGSVVFGLISPGLPSGWDNNSLIIAKDSGARYVAIKGTLYPVLNTASAQLVIPANDFRVVSVDESKIVDAPRGETVGIAGAPDSIPASSDLLGTGWASCTVASGGEATTLSAGAPSVDTTSGAIVATVNGQTFVVADGVRYQVDGSKSAAVLRAVGLDTATPIAVSARWISLFSAGSDLRALDVDKAGSALPRPLEVDGRSLTVGTVVHAQDTPAEKRYVLTSSGELAQLSPFGYQLYLLGSGAQLGGEVEVTANQLEPFANATEAAEPADWPQAEIEPADSRNGACAALGQSDDGSTAVVLATPRERQQDTTVFVSPGHGALARAVNTGDSNKGIVYLITDAGTAFPIPDASDDILARLGYSQKDVTDVPQSWITLFGEGPSLTVDAASSEPGSTTNAGTSK